MVIANNFTHELRKHYEHGPRFDTWVNKGAAEGRSPCTSVGFLPQSKDMTIRSTGDLSVNGPRHWCA